MMVAHLRLKGAFLCYCTDEETHYGESTHYWQIHPVVADPKGVPHLQAGRSVTRAELESLCRQISPSLLTRIGWVDPTLLAYGFGASGPLIFFRPSVRRPIYFGRGTDLKSGMTVWPSMVMVADPGGLSVYVVEGEKRPGLDAPLLKPPFFNVYIDHRVCTGKTKTPRECRPSDIDAWAESFYNSAFTHPNAHDRDFLVKGTIEKLWSELLSGKRKRFPYHLLRPAGKTLRQLLIERNLYEPKRPPSAKAPSNVHGAAV